MKIIILILTLASTTWAQSTHVVQPNQTLYSIARQYKVSVEQLRDWNQITDSIRTGQVLTVRAGVADPNTAMSPFRYTVRNGDTLGALSIKYGTSVDELLRINALSSATLYAGQRVYIRRPVGITFYTVQAGDSLSQISALFDISTNDLVAINQVQTLTPGQVLRVFKPQEVPLNHTVAATDTLAGVAALYNMTPTQISALNGGLSTLTPGQTLRLKPYASAGQGLAKPSAQAVTFPTDTVPTTGMRSYTVQKGDTLLRIARQNNVTVPDLLAWNSMPPDAVIRVGQKLNIGNPTLSTAAKAPTPIATPSPSVAPSPIAFPEDKALPAFRDEDQSKIRWDRYVVLDRTIPVFEWSADYYYWTHPGEVSQPNRGYYESSWPSPLDAYQKAKLLLSKFDELVVRAGSLSNVLAGYTIVLDPGHGGQDPGAIVKTVDASGGDAWLTEHEYVYDVALRMYALLRRHGANVVLTILAPNHLIRDTENDVTLINDKNQVYNDFNINQLDTNDSWPMGSQKGLERRVNIADRAYQGTAVGKRVFISLHADNNPDSPLGTGVYALGTGGNTDARSLSWAQKLVPYLGTDAYARTQNLGVLRGNPADYKVLIEVHNLASLEQAQAMQAGSSRQLSAQKIVRGLLEAFR